MPRRTRPHPPDTSRLAKARLRQLKEAAFRGTFTHWCADHGLPAPAFEHQFDSTRRWRFDVAWLVEKVALEIEGSVWHAGRHTRGAGFLKDAEKYNTAAALGWRVLRVARPPQGPTVKAVLYHPQLATWLRALL